MKSRVIHCSDEYDDTVHIYTITEEKRLALDTYCNGDENTVIVLDRDTAEELATALIEFFDELDQED